jgi:hypothetical protein
LLIYFSLGAVDSIKEAHALLYLNIGQEIEGVVFSRDVCSGIDEAKRFSKKVKQKEVKDPAPIKKRNQGRK